MPKPGCRDCHQAIAAFRSTDDEGHSGDPLEWAENHLWFHDRRRKNWKRYNRKTMEDK